MKNFLENPYISIAARLIAGAMFIATGIAKIIEPHQFAREIANYAILPDFLINISALALPWVELISGLLFVVGLRLRANATIIGGLLIVFIIAVASAWARGLNIDCGCYSEIASQKVGLEKILENTGLLILTIYVFINPSRKFTLEKKKK